MLRTTAAALVSVLCLSAVPAGASDSDATTKRAATTTGVTAPLAGDVDWSLPPVEIGGASRGSVLPGLYVGFAGLQAYDGYTTLAGIKRGAVESNTVMRAVSGNSAALWAVKGAATFGAIYIAERLWRRHHRAEAIVMMVASNGIMAAVAARNASVSRAQR